MSSLGKLRDNVGHTAVGKRGEGDDVKNHLPKLIKGSWRVSGGDFNELVRPERSDALQHVRRIGKEMA